ncbi:MAG: hypothetical protein ACI9EF_003198 [Pseudohongiellaceae bacterium]|jgi:hypothetical protein
MVQKPCAKLTAHLDRFATSDTFENRRMLRSFVPFAWGLAALSFCPATLSAQQFTRDASALSSPATWTNGVAVGDFDGDGEEDLAFANGAGYGAGGARPQRLYLGDGAGNFTDVSGQLNVANFNAQMVIADDADNDGDLDLIYSPAGAFPTTTERARILINDGSAVFSDESGARMPLTTMSSWSVVAADLDNDGDRDLVINDGCLTFNGQAAQAFLFENDGAGNYTDVTATHAPVEIYRGQDMICFDYDGDFDLDIAFSGFGTSGKRSSLWMNDGTGHFTVNPILDSLCTSNSYEVDWSDLDGDGDWDGAVQSISGSDEGWGQNRGPNVAPPKTTFSGANGNDDNELASMDYDMDGDMDVFVGSLAASSEKVYQQDAAGVFNRVNIFQTLTDSTLDFTFGDFDNDGRHDVVTAQGESGVQVNKIYDNSGPVDVFAPNVLQVESPSAVTAGELIFRVMLQDAWVDDGITNATASFSYETFVGGASESTGAGDGAFMGGAMYRAVVPTSALTEGVALVWTAADDAGNVAAPISVVVGNVGGDVWADLGQGLAGTGAMTPSLVGSGPLTGGSSNQVDLTGALANSSSTLVVGISQIDAPFKGGVLVPNPDVILSGLPVDGSGSATVPFVWPHGIPGGIDFFVQQWVNDAGGPVGFAASNGVRGRSQD